MIELKIKEKDKDNDSSSSDENNNLSNKHNEEYSYYDILFETENNNKNFIKPRHFDEITVKD